MDSKEQTNNQKGLLPVYNFVRKELNRFDGKVIPVYGKEVYWLKESEFHFTELNFVIEVVKDFLPSHVFHIFFVALEKKFGDSHKIIVIKSKGLSSKLSKLIFLIEKD